MKGRVEPASPVTSKEKTGRLALTGLAQLDGHHPAKQKVTG